jgi:hypothetical protein
MALDLPDEAMRNLEARLVRLPAIGPSKGSRN